MQRTLLVLAAGMGSRYGGLKQIDPVGPHGETIIDYSVYDALRSGFDQVVFVIRRDIEAAFRDAIGRRFENRVAVQYVFQAMDTLPAGHTVPPNRQKPWGTGQAILMAAEAIREPFAVINGDDFYGEDSFRLLAGHLRPENPEYAMVGFVLRATLSEFGSVARGICQLSPEGLLKGVQEITKIEKDGTGAKYVDDTGVARHLTGEEMVSMNMWGLNPTIFGHLEKQFAQFLAASGRDEKAEFYIPKVVNSLVSSGAERVRMLRTRSAWFGITYREDRPLVTEGMRKLIASGSYPEKLWP
jgi:MobA-like NTP transferase domain